MDSTLSDWARAAPAINQMTKKETRAPETSVIIRTKNEERFLPSVLEALDNQTYQNFEIIIIDDNSTDKTLEIAKQYNCRIVHIPPGKFSHPYSCNLGAENSKGKYLVYLNGHSIPISKTWLGDGIKNFRDQKVAGVYASPIAHKGSTLADKLLWNVGGYTIGSLRYGSSKSSLGLMGTTNAIARKDLWQRYKFNEKYGRGWGGEDGDWARHFMDRGYKIIHDPRFRVRHSHLLKMNELFWQLKNWLKMHSHSNIPEKQKRNF